MIALRVFARRRGTGRDAGSSSCSTNKGELAPADYAHMQKIAAYIKRHSAQRPHGDIEHTAWRYSVIN
jgi:hypothetical protein